MRAFLIALLMTLATQVGAEIRNYGTFIYNSDFKNTLFFLDEIAVADSFELRKALRNHPIDTLVLASPGGSVWEGLTMAGLIFDKGLRVYVPEGAKCASACSFMFFGGKERLTDGDLGVHQFASSDGVIKEKKSETQADAQFTVSEIIGFLNEFGTPRFVLERMFEDRDMYWFNDAEKKELNTVQFDLAQTDKRFFAAYVSTELKNRKLEQAKAPKLSQKEMVQIIQKRLNEIGCNAGSVDGIWGRRTESAALAFAKKAGLPTSFEELVSERFVKKLLDAPAGFCPKPQKLGVRKFARYYDGYCGTRSIGAVVEISAVNLRNKTANWSWRGMTEMIKWNGQKFTTWEGIEARFIISNSGFVTEMRWSNNNCANLRLVAR